MITTANRRGHRAIWGVIDGIHYLIGIEGKTIDTKGKRMLSNKELFPLFNFLQKTKFTGKIKLKGRSSDYVITGNTITYTDELMLYFKAGKLVKISTSTHKRKLQSK